jgi:hypothetical protein
MRAASTTCGRRGGNRIALVTENGKKIAWMAEGRELVRLRMKAGADYRIVFR